MPSSGRAGVAPDEPPEDDAPDEPLDDEEPPDDPPEEPLDDEPPDDPPMGVAPLPSSSALELVGVHAGADAIPETTNPTATILRMRTAAEVCERRATTKGRRLARAPANAAASPPHWRELPQSHRQAKAANGASISAHVTRFAKVEST